MLVVAREIRSSLSETVPSREAHRRLTAAVLAITPEIGPNRTAWPDLVTYRFTRPQASQWVDGRSLALCLIVDDRKRFVVGDEDDVCALGQYTLLRRGMRFQTSIVEATEDAPYLSLLLRLDPAVTYSVLVDMADHRAQTSSAPRRTAVVRGRPVSALDDKLEAALVRFPWSLATVADQRVLAPAPPSTRPSRSRPMRRSGFAARSAACAGPRTSDVVAHGEALSKRIRSACRASRPGGRSSAGEQSDGSEQSARSPGYCAPRHELRREVRIDGPGGSLLMKGVLGPASAVVATPAAWIVPSSAGDPLTSAGSSTQAGRGVEPARVRAMRSGRPTVCDRPRRSARTAARTETRRAAREAGG